MKNIFTKRLATVLLLFVLLTGFITKKAPKSIKKALITFYAKRYNGRRTASGSIYSDNNLTCATTNKKFFGHNIRFWNCKHEKCIIVKCNDLMAPDSGHLRFDLTTRAFKALNHNSLNCGVMQLEYNVLK